MIWWILRKLKSPYYEVREKAIEALDHPVAILKFTGGTTPALSGITKLSNGCLR